jgi:hypothetical protein
MPAVGSDHDEVLDRLARLEEATARLSDRVDKGGAPGGTTTSSSSTAAPWSPIRLLGLPSFSDAWSPKMSM